MSGYARALWYGGSIAVTALVVVLWQAIGLGWGLATVGTLIGLGTVRQSSGLANGVLSQLTAVLHGQSLLPSAGLLAVAALVIHFAIGLIVTVFWIVAIVAVIAAAIWALNTIL